MTMKPRNEIEKIVAKWSKEYQSLTLPLIEWVKTILKVNSELMYIGSAIGAFISLAVGGFDQALLMLVVLVIIDYFSGLGASLKAGKANSKRGFIGLGRKFAIFAVVALSNVVDGAMQTNHLIRSMVIFGYAANEAISIIENLDVLGYGHLIPDFLRNKLERLKEEKLK